MNVACPGCGTRYAVADDKVRGRRVRITCKHCSTPIVVDGTTGRSDAAPSGSVGPAAPRRVAAQPTPPVNTPLNREPSAAHHPRTPLASAAAGDRAAPAVAPKAGVKAPSATRTPTGVVALPPPAPAPRPTEPIERAPASGKPPVPQGPPRVAAQVPRRPPARAVRETIIGVAAPANAPPELAVQRPTPPVSAQSARAVAGVDRPHLVASGAAKAAPGAGNAPSPPRAPNRAMRQTIIGVAAPANAPPSLDPRSERPVVAPLRVVTPPVVAEPEPSDAARLRPAPNLKRTIVGGLEAAPGSAPTPPAAQAVGLGIPTETKWGVLIPKQGTVEMTAPDLVRAVVEGRLTRETNVWREGLDGWKPIHEVDSLRALFHRAGVSLDPPRSADPPTATPRPKTKSLSGEPSRAASVGRKPHQSADVGARAHAHDSEPPPTARTPALTDVSDELFDAVGGDDSDDDDSDNEVTRIAASPWEVPDVGAKAAARLASSAGLPPRQNSTPPRQTMALEDQDHPPLERPSRRPDIGPRDTVRGQLGAISSAPAPHPADRLSREPLPEPRIPKQSRPAPTSAVAAPPRVLVPAAPPAPSPLVPPSPLLPPVPSNASPPLALVASNSPPAAPSTLAANPTNAKTAKHKVRRVWVTALLLLVTLSGAAAISYRTKQPRALYAYLHRRGWDTSIDRGVARSTQGLRDATQKYVVLPIRSFVDKTRKSPRK